MPYLSPNKRAGFTLVEMLIISPIILLMVGVIISVVIVITGDVLASRSQLVQVHNTQDAIDTIEQDIRLSNRYLAQNRISVSAPQGLNGDGTQFTNVSSTTGTKLILQSFSTDKNPLDISRSLVFLENSPNACGSDGVMSNTPFYTNIVYFIKNNTLYRRMIVAQNPVPPACDAIWQRPSCASGAVNGTNCKVEDVTMLSNVSAFSIDYYELPSGTTSLEEASSTSVSVTDRNALLSVAKTAVIGLSTSQQTAGRTISFSSTLRATLINTPAE